MINIPKGTKDVLPQESYKWHYVENIAREIASVFALSEIRTPVFEHTELFLRGVGETTDIVNKEMYTFLDKGDRSITLKPEGTAGVVRSFIENGLDNEQMPLKMFYFTPVFRYERPQAGRLREHHQFGVEIYGAKNADMDAEVIILAKSFFDKLNIPNVSLNINSIGCKVCRPDYNKKLKEYYFPNLENMCPLCKERFEKNPLRMLDCKEQKCIEINKDAPNALDCLCSECDEHFELLKKYLAVAGVDFIVNPRIVRGLDYYSKTVFEFISQNVGSQGTICGGGRYDRLIENLGGKPSHAVGFGLGLERLLLLMKNIEVLPNAPKTIDAYFIAMNDSAYLKCFGLLNNFRKIGIKSDIDHVSRSFKAQFKYANKLNIPYVFIMGDDELNNDVVKLKCFETSEEFTIPLNYLYSIFDKKETINFKSIILELKNNG